MEDSDVCAHCGQPLPGRQVVTYGQKGPSRTGVIVTIALHLLLVAVYLIQPKIQITRAQHKAGEAIVWLPPAKQVPKPKAAEAAPEKSAKPTPTQPSAIRPPRMLKMPRLPDTITIPNEKPQPVDEKPTPAKEEVKEPPKEIDMAEYIKNRQKARGAPSQADGEESDAARGTRNALANIAAINGRSGQDPNDTGGVFSVTNQTFSRADLKFRGWNQNFKRRWLTSVTVERGGERDIETAIVKKMIELIRKEKTGDFEWDSHRLGKVVTMSARPQDTQELTDFLFKEMFPEYKPPRG